VQPRIFGSILDFKLSPCSECCMLSWHLPAYEDGKDSVPKRWHMKFRRRGITQKTAYNIWKHFYKHELLTACVCPDFGVNTKC